MGFTDLALFGERAVTIDGMTTLDGCNLLYTMCLLQPQNGDVVEIGSWVGRSSVYLAKAVVDSKNGEFFAIDNFKGNPGKEAAYVVDMKDLSDLRAHFESNLRRMDLWHAVNLIDSASSTAVPFFGDRRIRFLFIDGDHSYEAVRGDIENFLLRMVPGGLICFDDYNAAFPDVTRAVLDVLVDAGKGSILFAAKNTVVVRVNS